MKWGGMLFASLLMVSSCQNEEIIETPSAGGQRISLTVGREGGSRTALVGDQAVWSKGDKIYVSSKDGKTTGVLTLQGEGGDATGTFSGFVFGNPANLAYSVYPAPTNGTTIDLANILASGQLNAPMIGAINQSADVDVQFRNQCGILYINMNGSEGENFQITANDIDIATDNTETVNVLQFAGTFDVKNISWASDGTPSLIFDNPTSFINVKNTNVAGSNSSVMYVPYYITTTNVALDKVTFMAGGTPMNDVPINFIEAENGFVGSVAKNSINELKSIAKIGDVVYASLQGAVNAVEDGGTITLVANETFTEQNRYNNGGYWDGLGYSGDKSFTIDLNGKTISQNGALNDYLMWFKNVGAKENVITIKNGTLDAGTTAYCALCTASSHENKLTINLENVTLKNNNSNGSTVKIRAGSVLNVNAGTKIIGENSYLGIENWNATVNIYDGAEIYMNGTSSYNGCLVGVGGNGTINVDGGYGKGVSGGLIAMTSGGTINVSGGEWIANTDGTFANSNKSVLIAQSDKQYNAGAGNAVVNVTGGTFKGGYNCYGNAVGDAQINISGGCFNADPSTYLTESCVSREVDNEYIIIAHDKESNTYTARDAKSFAAINAMMLDKSAGKYAKVVLANDIDFSGYTWTPVDSHADTNFWLTELDGQNHTISNLTINGQAMFTRFAGLGDVTIKNVTFDKANVNSNGKINTSILTVQTYQNVSLENVDVKYSSIIGGYKVAPLIATVYDESSSTITAKFKNCDVEDVTVKATQYDFCTTGMVAFVNAGDNDKIEFENCTVKNVELYAPNGYNAHAAIYTTGSSLLFNEAEGVTVTNVTFENI